ncbi:hypothetical protein [Ramlibacter henchirensis]|uniref:hypothetical protein n=1 Tax=Ramlibacter henchirensis TaxID=204072 RepID=UPI0014310E34|nr:hypothetical protein [Ramlibacter henchirensis]
MIPYEVDPSLHPAQPTPPQLDDGFSPPPADAEAKPPVPGAPVAEPVDPALWAKSDF